MAPCAMAALANTPSRVAGGCVPWESRWGSCWELGSDVDQPVDKAAEMAVFHGRKAQSCHSLKLMWAMLKACSVFCTGAATTCVQGENGRGLNSCGKSGVPWSGSPCRGVRGGTCPQQLCKCSQLTQQCEMLPHKQLTLTLQSYFSPSVFFQLMSCCQSPY